MVGDFQDCAGHFAFLGSALAIQFNASTSRPLELLYVFIILSYVFTASTLYFLKRIRNIQLYAYFQIIYDLVVETGIIYITGGVESLFTFTYILLSSPPVFSYYDAEHLLPPP